MAQYGASVACVVTALLTSSCGTGDFFESNQRLADDAGEVGRVRLAVLATMPWPNIVTELSPGFVFDPEAALLAVAPSTRVFEQSRLQGVGLSASVAASPAVNAAGAPNVPSSPPETSNAAAEVIGQRTAQDALSTLSAEILASALGTYDPIFLHDNANALAHHIAILNNSINYATTREGRVPYLVRLQLSTFPNARHQPYDLFTQIDFFAQKAGGPDQNDPGLVNLPVVVPIVATENNESGIVNRADSAVRQIALAASALSAGFGGAFDFEAFSEELNRATGRDLNSLLNVGLIADNSLLVRTGARLSATSGYEFIARAHNISLLLLIPSEAFVFQCSDGRSLREGNDFLESDEPYYLNLIARNEFKNAITGELLDPIDGSTLIDDVYELFTTALISDSSGQLVADKYNRHEFEENLGDLLLDLRNAVQTSDFEYFKKTLTDAGLATPYEEVLWSGFAAINAKSEYASSGFDLIFNEVMLPAQTPILVGGSGVDQVQVVLGAGANPARTRATLEVNANGRTYSFPNISTSPGTGGDSLVFQFPSLKDVGLSLQAGEIGALVVEHLAPDGSSSPCNTGPMRLETVLYRPPSGGGGGGGGTNTPPGVTINVDVTDSMNQQ